MGSVPAWGTKIPQAKRGGQKEKRQRNWVDSFPKCLFHGQQVHGKIVNITNRQGNANRFMSVEWQSPRRRQLTSAGKNVEKRESLCIVTTMENSMEVPQNLKRRTTISPGHPTSRCVSEGSENRVSKNPTHCSLQSQQMKRRRRHGVHARRNGGCASVISKNTWEKWK